MSYKIGILIPSTTNKRDWKKIEDTSLYNVFLKSFLITYSNEYNYTLYLTIDPDDKLYSIDSEIEKLKRFISIMKNIELKIVYTTDIPKGWVTHMWNRAFKIAYDDNCDYFLQCGDDIHFLEKDWVKESIKILEKNDNIGLTGPMDYDRIKSGRNSWPGGARFIQTQNFISRKHMDIFGFLFPPQLKNWYCDDWITKVYYETGNFHLIRKFIRNIGGVPRYEIIGSLKPGDPVKCLCDELIKYYSNTINEYCKKN